jgi:replicative DNA helicase
LNETEYALIGCMIIDNFRIPDILNIINKDDFQDKKCKKIFITIVKMFESNKKIDLVSLNEALKGANIRIETLTQMIDIVPSTEACKHYIKIIKENSAKYKMYGLLNTMQYKLRKNDFSDIESFRSECIDKFNFDTGIKSNLDTNVLSYLTKFLDEIKTNKNKPIISTGFSSLNQKLGGGIFPGLYILGAISSLGKTSFALQIADNMAANGHQVLYLTTEMPKIELVSRSISRFMYKLNKEKCNNIGTLKIMRGDFYNHIEEMNLAMQNYEKVAKNLIIQKCKFNASIKDIINLSKTFINKAKSNPVIFVDYLQTISADTYNDKQRTDQVIAGLKEISTDYSIPVISVSSFNRTNYTEKVDFSSYKESGSIEYTADVLLGLQLSVLDEIEISDKNRGMVKSAIASAKAEIPRKISAIVLKQRNGVARVKQDFLFYPVNNYFQEV